MGRRLGDGHNELRIDDNISGDIIVLYYRMPTPSEIAEYDNKQIQRKRNKVNYKQGEVRLVYGEKILLGFRPGDFERPGPDGTWIKIASDKDHELYFEGWLDIVKKSASDLISVLARYVFEGSAADDDSVELESD
ncbi:MAG: hypothetical protein ABIK68_05265 [bacterium]